SCIACAFSVFMQQHEPVERDFRAGHTGQRDEVAALHVGHGPSSLPLWREPMMANTSCASRTPERRPLVSTWPGESRAVRCGYQPINFLVACSLSLRNLRYSSPLITRGSRLNASALAWCSFEVRTFSR